METPECDKMLKVQPDSQKIGEFIDWLHSNGYEIAYYPPGEETRTVQRLSSIPESIERLLADYFEIDLKKVEIERRAMLDEIRSKG